MTDLARKRAALRFRALLDKGLHRKQAMFDVRQELKAKGLPYSEASIYVWCKQFKVSTR